MKVQEKVNLVAQPNTTQKSVPYKKKKSPQFSFYSNHLGLGEFRQRYFFLK